VSAVQTGLGVLEVSAARAGPVGLAA